MDLNTYFLISVSVFCTLATLYLIGMFIAGLFVRVRIVRILNKVEEIADSANTVSAEVKDFTLNTLESLERFKDSILTFEFFQKIIVAIVELFQRKSDRKKR
jgi:hypothetical protein